MYLLGVMFARGVRCWVDMVAVRRDNFLRAWTIFAWVAFSSAVSWALVIVSLAVVARSAAVAVAKFAMAWIVSSSNVLFVVTAFAVWVQEPGVG